MRRPVSTPGRGSGCRLAVKRCALGPAGRPVGDGGAEHPLGGGQVEPGARSVRDHDGAVVLEAAVVGGVIGRAVVPAAPQDAGPGAAEDADGVGVAFAAGARVGVEGGRPWGAVPGVVGEDVQGLAGAAVGGQAERMAARRKWTLLVLPDARVTG